MLLLTPGAPARIQVVVPAPEGKRPDTVNQLCTELFIMNSEGTVVAMATVVFEAAGHTPAGTPVVATATIPAADATAAAVALAGRDGTWELVLCPHGSCPSGSMILEKGTAHSTISTRRRAFVPRGCTDCGASWGGPQ